MPSTMAWQRLRHHLPQLCLNSDPQSFRTRWHKVSKRAPAYPTLTSHQGTSVTSRCCCCVSQQLSSIVLQPSSNILKLYLLSILQSHIESICANIVPQSSAWTVRTTTGKPSRTTALLWSCFPRKSSNSAIARGHAAFAPQAEIAVPYVTMLGWTASTCKTRTHSTWMHLRTH